MSFVVFYRSSPLRVVFWKNFRERTFVIGCWCRFCVFWWVFAYVFALFFAVRSRNCSEKILLMSGLVLSEVVLSPFGFFPRRRRRSPFFFCFFLFFRDKVQVVTGHPRTRTCFSGFFLFVSRRFCLFRPFWPCVPLLGVFPGCHSGPRAVLGFSLDLLRPFFLGREAARVFVCFFCFVFLFPPFRVAATPFLE